MNSCVGRNLALRNVFPTSTRNYLVNGHMAHAAKNSEVLPTDSPSVIPDEAKHSNLFLGEFTVYVIASFRSVLHGCKSVFLASWLSPLGNFVCTIIGVRPKEKMVRPSTLWSVALVQNAKAIWNWAVGKFPRRTVDPHLNVIDACHSITFLIKRASPNPARPKLWLEWWNWTVHIELSPKHFWGSFFIRFKSKVQVVGVHAKYLVATVHHRFVFRSAAVCQVPRNPMGEAMDRTVMELCSASAVEISNPKPAFVQVVRFLNFAPELFFKVFHGRNKKPARWLSSAICTADTGRESRLDALNCIVGRLCGQTA